MGITSRTLMTIAALLLSQSYISVFINPVRLWWANLFGLLFIPLAFLNLFLLVWALFRRSMTFMIPLVALVPAWFIAGLYYQKGEVLPPPSDNDVKIVSYNVGRFGASKEKMAPEQCADSVVALLKGEKADIICLQEFYLDDISNVNKWLSGRFKGYYVDYYVYPLPDGCFGNVILSRYKFKEKGKIEFDNSANLAIYGDCTINGQDLRIYNCHFQSYNLSLPHLVKSVRKDYREAMKYTEEKMKFSVPVRARQVDTVLRHIEDCPLEAVVTGDFNDTPLSYTYRRMSKGRNDSFCKAGHGFGATFYALKPLLRIDYVLGPERFDVVDHEVVNKRFSDHYPVMAKIRIAKDH